MGRPKLYGNDRQIVKNIVKELYFKGLTMRRISSIMNISLTTVYNLINEL